MGWTVEDDLGLIAEDGMVQLHDGPPIEAAGSHPWVRIVS